MLFMSNFTLSSLNKNLGSFSVMYGNLIITLCVVNPINFTYIHSASTIHIIKCFMFTTSANSQLKLFQLELEK